jgi:hypothetical protein
MKAAHDDAAPERVSEKNPAPRSVGFSGASQKSGHLKRSFIIAMLETEVELVLL